jgi:hypothetical protein
MPAAKGSARTPLGPKIKQLMPKPSHPPKHNLLYSLHLLLILHHPFFILNPPPSILHSASFNFQPYSRGRSLTLKKPFLSFVACLGLMKIIIRSNNFVHRFGYIWLNPAQLKDGSPAIACSRTISSS